MKPLKHSGIQYQCEYYPCHEDLDDCTFCYCPYYPCNEKIRGGNWITKDIYDCANCNWIHKVKNVEMIYDIIQKDNE